MENGITEFDSISGYDDLILSCVLGVIVMNSAKEPAEQQPIQLMDTEAASKIKLYENKRRFFEI